MLNRLVVFILLISFSSIVSASDPRGLEYLISVPLNILVFLLTLTISLASNGKGGQVIVYVIGFLALFFNFFLLVSHLQAPHRASLLLDGIMIAALILPMIIVYFKRKNDTNLTKRELPNSDNEL